MMLYCGFSVRSYEGMRTNMIDMVDCGGADIKIF
jgi:hypothetical protein